MVARICALIILNNMLAKGSFLLGRTTTTSPPSLLQDFITVLLGFCVQIV